MSAQVVVTTSPSASILGATAADLAAARLCNLANHSALVPVVFATGASQLETLRALTRISNVPWNRVVGFHLDEYLGINANHPASFRRYLKEELVSRVPMRSFWYIEGDAVDPEAVCAEYAMKLRQYPPKLCLLGIGENGHLAFNDPGEADFNDSKQVKLVNLDQACRKQQVSEGWFQSMEEVPERAITLSIPALMAIPELIASVPGKRKAAIVRRVFSDPVSPEVPATILRTHPNVSLFLDEDSAAARDDAGTLDCRR